MEKPESIAAALRAAGSALNPQNAALTQSLFAGQHEREPYKGVRVARDQRYGPDPRHRLDVFAPEAGGTAPLLLFVHGGGFVRGDKRIPDQPYYDNVGLFAARNGMVGVTMTYRLAPDHVWPAGAEDVGTAVAWLQENAKSWNADSKRIFVIGTSAGAAHAAGYLASVPDPGVAGAILVSGIYDLALAGIAPHTEAYFGIGSEEERSPLGRVAGGVTPLLLVMSELDPPEFQRQTLALAGALLDRRGAAPLVVLRGHNHFSGILHLNGRDPYLGAQILDFCAVGGP